MKRSVCRSQAVVLTIAMLCGSLGYATSGADAAFVAENTAAMSRMMTAMSVKPSGDVDQDFVATMIPHHQGAIDMAQAELRHGHNEQLRRLAQEIIIEQSQEIAAMRLALGAPPPPSVAAPAQGPGPGAPERRRQPP